ncbi:MAG: hypothetical protein M3457_19225 [Chloroflexota bacterium]|nr:hypothetical protein [Chloroflexota bacterium]
MRSAAPLNNFSLYLIPAQGTPSRGEVFSPCRNRQPPKLRERDVLKFSARFIIMLVDRHV